MSRLKEWFEKIAYAGMKPGRPAVKPGTPAESPPQPGLLDRFLNRPTASGPLYLSNRTMGQKVRLGILIALPPLLVLGLGFALVQYFGNTAPEPVRQPTPGEVASKLMPDLSSVSVYTNPEVDVMDVSVHHGHLAGSVKNNTDRPIAGVHVIFDLTNNRGSRLGAVECAVPTIPPKGHSKFEQTVPQKDAAFAIVSEVRTK